MTLKQNRKLQETKRNRGEKNKRRKNRKKQDKQGIRQTTIIFRLRGKGYTVKKRINIDTALGGILKQQQRTEQRMNLTYEYQIERK